jgi:hypothetical protein
MTNYQMERQVVTIPPSPLYIVSGAVFPGIKLFGTFGTKNITRIVGILTLVDDARIRSALFAKYFKATEIQRFSTHLFLLVKFPRLYIIGLRLVLQLFWSV